MGLNKKECQLVNLINEEEVISVLKRVVRANSENPTGDESAVADIIAEELEAAGVSIRQQPIEEKRWNVIAEIKGRCPDMMLFNGHMDTVLAGDLSLWNDDPWGAVIRDGKLYGLGASDMKAGVVAMLIAVKTLMRLGGDFERGLMFTAVIDEEVGFKGTSALIAEEILTHCKLACVSEPTGLRIANRLKGALEYNARTLGKSTHTGVAFLGDNAIYKMGRYVEELRQYNDSLSERIQDPDLKYPTVNVGKISGGVGVTLVPHSCEIEFDRQVLPGESIAETKREIRELTEEFTRKTGIEVELTLRQGFNNWSVKAEEPVVTSLVAVHQDLNGGVMPLTAGFNGYAEVELLASAGIPSVLYGPGSLESVHAPNEYVQISQVVDAARVFALWAYRYMISND